MEDTIMQTFRDFPIIRRANGSYVITYNGYPYHVVNDEEMASFWAEIDAYAQAHPEQVTDEPAPPVPTEEELLARAKTLKTSEFDRAMADIDAKLARSTSDIVAAMLTTATLAAENADELEKSKAQLASYEAQLAARKTALDIAQTRYNRELKLRRSDSTSRENLESAQQTLASARADVAEMESQITQTRLAVSTAETNLGYNRISAPLDGTVVSVPVEEGQTVNANQTTPTIVQVADLSRMENKIEISEGDITRVTPGMPVIYTILSEPDISFRARLDSIDPGNTSVTDASSSSSVSSSSSSSSGDAVYYYGKSVVSNEDGRLRIGMTTQNTIIVSRAQDVLIVPSIVLEKRMERGRTSYFAQVLTPAGAVEERAVETGISDNLNTQIISGLTEGEQVVSSMMTRAEEAAASVAGMRRPRMR